jgi:nitroreductase
MDFDTVINNRKTNFTWTDQEVDKDKIKSIINNTLSKVPSKQKRMPYKIDVFDYSDKELRKEIFLHTKRDGKLTVEQDPYNPQTLAPILLVFSMRNSNQALSKLNRKITPHDKEGQKDKRVIFMEMGIVAMSLMLAFEAEGFATGFCQCIENKKELGNTLNLSYPVDLMMGVGYPSTKENYIDPNTNTVKEVFWEHHLKRPSLDDVVTYRF